MPAKFWPDRWSVLVVSIGRDIVWSRRSTLDAYGRLFAASGRIDEVRGRR